MSAASRRPACVVEPQVFKTLIVLVENRGRLCEKAWLMSEVWGDTVVEEGNLLKPVFFVGGLSALVVWLAFLWPGDAGKAARSLSDASFAGFALSRGDRLIYFSHFTEEADIWLLSMP